MPGLLRGVARTAVVAGTATAVSNRVSRRQAGRWAAQDDRSAPALPTESAAARAGGMDDRIAQLKELGALREQGVLTDAEFAAQKAQVMGS